MAEERDYYEILGVSKTATEDELKSAFRQLVRKYHPDVNKEPGAEDRFKEINDTAGHRSGDEAIQKVAELLEQSVRKEDVVIRYGGDEFLMVFFDITMEDLEHKLLHLKSAVKDIVIEDSPEVKITMSFGAAFGTELVNNLIESADKALYESKEKRDAYTIIEI